MLSIEEAQMTIVFSVDRRRVVVPMLIACASIGVLVGGLGCEAPFRINHCMTSAECHESQQFCLADNPHYPGGSALGTAISPVGLVR